MAFAPSDPSVIYAGTGQGNATQVGQGLLKSSDGGSSWSLLAASTFARTAFSDNGFERWTGVDTWRSVFGFDGMDVALASARPESQWALAIQFLQIFRFPNAAPGDNGIDKNGAPFIAHLEKCPANDDVFIGGTDNLWRSTDFFTAVAPSWSANGPEMGVCSNARHQMIGGCGRRASPATSSRRATPWRQHRRGRT